MFFCVTDSIKESGGGLCFERIYKPFDIFIFALDINQNADRIIQNLTFKRVFRRQRKHKRAKSDTLNDAFDLNLCARFHRKPFHLLATEFENDSNNLIHQSDFV